MVNPQQNGCWWKPVLMVFVGCLGKTLPLPLWCLIPFLFFIVLWERLCSLLWNMRQCGLFSLNMSGRSQVITSVTQTSCSWTENLLLRMECQLQALKGFSRNTFRSLYPAPLILIFISQIYLMTREVPKVKINKTLK